VGLALRYSMQGNRWTPNLFALINITLVLFFLGIFAMIALSFDLIIRTAKEQQEMKVILSDATTEAEARFLLDRLKNEPYAKEIRYVTKQGALKEFQYAGEDFLDAMDGINPLPASLNLRLKDDFQTSEEIMRISRDLLKNREVQEVDFPIKLIEQANENRTIIYQIAAVVGIVLVLIAYFLIHNTIRLSIYGRRLVIRSMQLIGATRGFIMRPYLGIGLAQGFFGGVLAVALIHGMLSYLSANYLNLDILTESSTLLVLYASLITFGTLLGFFSSWMAVSRYLDKPLEQLA
jgi:cell division transport system permease protein